MKKKNKQTVKGKINIPLNAFAPIYVNQKALTSPKRFLVLYGGAGSGKSWFAAQKIIYRMLSEKNHVFLCVRKFATDLKESMFNLLKGTIESWGLADLFEFRVSPLEIKCVNGNRIIFKGMDDPEKVKSIFGISGVWIEEASQINPHEFEQLNLRIRGDNLKNYVQYILTFNPVSEHNWLKKRFFDFYDEDAFILKTTYKDNPFLDKQYHKNMEKLKETNLEYYSVYALGDWGVLGHLIYKNYTVKDISIDSSDYEIVYSGLDFGFNDPSAYIRIGIKDDELYIFKEFYKRELTNTELIEEIGKIHPKKDWLICDSAEQDRIKEFKQKGFNRLKGAKKGKGSIKDGIDHIKSHKIYIHPNCTEFIREIQGYTWKQDKDGNIYDEPDKNCSDHLLDAMRYAMELKKKKKEIKVMSGSLY